jgi:hypothetical protein
MIMNKKIYNCFLVAFTIFFCFNSLAFNKINKDTLPSKKEQSQSDKISLLTYMRVISDSKGSVRTDENIVPKFKLLNWLKLELGFRYGERPQYFNSYYHYKIELQTKSFWKTVRLIARISDNVISFPYPSYRKTNELFVVETKYKLAPMLQCIAAGGYVFSTQQNNDTRALPTSQGNQTNYPVFKLAIKYLLKDKGHVEIVYGSYDVFNPYEINRPFTQIGWEYELAHSCSLYSYARYQYDYNVFKAYNYFLGLGVIIHLLKD